MPRLTDAHEGEPAPQSPQTDNGCLDGEEVAEEDLALPDNMVDWIIIHFTNPSEL